MFPEAVHFGSRRLADYRPESLERFTPRLRDMVSLMDLLLALYLGVNIHLLMSQALSGAPREAARAIVHIEPWLVGALLVGQEVTIAYYLRRFDAASKREGAADRPGP